MTIEELSRDLSFLEGLRKGEYCLVLGAGFSISLKNTTSTDSLKQFNDVIHSDFETIPLVKKYIALTNKIFGENVSKGESAANTWSNNNFSVRQKGVEINLKEFYKNLFTLDEEWFRKNELNSYKNILIPDWYQIYTFNFDNVFETIVKLRGRVPFYSLHFPERTGIDRTDAKAIIHLHGYISETDPEKLTFSDETYNFLRDTKHTLYDQFYTDVDAGKKLVIIGTQFDEKVIDDKFFDGLKDKNITIYHFDLYNDNFKTKPGIHNNKNYHFIQIKDTHDVLGFFEKNKVHIENIHIDGADVINPDFIDKVTREGIAQLFTASDFYLAKQKDECQWYGIVKNWVVERENYQEIKKEVISSFSDPNRISKISALVWGKGGSGKSTLLRKLAVELNDEDFTVLWIKDKEIQTLFVRGLSQLREYYQDRQFLVVIEDIYRIKKLEIKLNNIIDSICSNKNVRMVIGDRSNDDTIYREHIYNPDKNIFELRVDDNKRTIEKLLENIPEWRKSAELLLKNENDYKSTLYYILWTIGRTAQKNLEDIATLNHEDLTSHFRSLVQSDLKELTVHYPGVAQMLFYWATMYATSNIYIAFDLFLKLADLFKPQSYPESRLIEASEQNKSILEIYAHKATGLIKSAGEVPLLAFNHDILAEEGLSKSVLKGWNPFDDSIKLRILPVIIDEGDNFSASVFLLHCLIHIEEVLFSNEEKKKWINVLRSKDNYNNYLIPAFTKKYFSRKEITELAIEILSHENFWNLPHSLVTIALNITRDKTKADVILSLDNFWNLPSSIVCMALNISNNKEKAYEILSRENFWNLSSGIVSTALSVSEDKEIAGEILRQENFWNLQFEIVCTALNITKDKDKADKILSQDDFWTLQHHIVSTALKISQDKEKADKILSQDNLWDLPFEIVSTALKISQDKEKADNLLSQWKERNLNKEIVSTALTISKDKVKADNILSQWKERNLDKEIVSTALNISKNKIKAEEIISQVDFLNLPHEILSTALNISKDKKKADEILSKDSFWNLPYQVVCTALNISKDKDKADKILSQEDLWNLSDQIVCIALVISEDENLKKRVGKLLFDSGKWKQHWNITFHILDFYSGQTETPQQVRDICSSIIGEFLYRRDSEKGNYFRYINLMKIPLHSIPVWKKNSLDNIGYWKNFQRNLVTNTLIAYFSRPDEIREMCEGILIDWRREISQPIYMLGRKIPPHYGDHIRISLGHPDLKEIAVKTAKEITCAESLSPGLIPEHLLTASNHLINENIFPFWGSENPESQAEHDVTAIPTITMLTQNL